MKNNSTNFAINSSMKTLSRQNGFIITIELILIATILVIGTIVGIVAIRDALVKQYTSKQSQKTWVVDDNGVVLGEAVDYDEHDAPRLFYIDRTQDDHYRVLISVRDDRFSSREPIYYPSNNCTGVPCIKSTSDELTDNTGVDGISGTGSVSYFNSLQGHPNYGIGSGTNGLPGYLFRETEKQCPVSSNAIKSRWLSQKVVNGQPCEAIDFDKAVVEDAYSACLTETVGSCDCPVGYNEQSDILSQYQSDIDTQLVENIAQINQIIAPTGQQVSDVNIGTLCCPDALKLNDSELVDAATYVILNTLINDIDTNGVPGINKQLNQLIKPLKNDITCSSFVNLKLAESVEDPMNNQENVLSKFQPPFWINLPIDNSNENWQSTVPDGEG